MDSRQTLIYEPPRGEARASLLWLHGLGAQADDFAAFGEQLDCPSLRLILPQAPMRPITLFDGQEANAWFDLLPQQDGSITSDLCGLNETATQLRKIMQQQRQDGIEQLMLGGYSQGGAMALYTTLTQAEPLDAAICLSGYLPQPDELQRHADQLSVRTPFFLAHGLEDTVVPYTFGELSRDALQRLGGSVHWYSDTFGHEVTPEETLELSKFLRRICTAASPPHPAL